MGEPELRRRAVALHTVALEDVERLGRERGIDLTDEADPSAGVHG